MSNESVVLSLPVAAGLGEFARRRSARALGLGAIAVASIGAGFLLGRSEGALAVIVAVASLVSSIAGFAFSAVAGAMLFHASHNTVRLVQIMMTCSLANQAAMTWAVRRETRWPSLASSLAGGLVGLPLGVALLMHADRSAYLAALGLFLTIYGLFMLVRKPARFRANRLIDALAGFAGGITGGVAAFPGAFVTIWAGMQGLSKDEQRGTFQPFILLMQIAGLAVIALAHGPGAAEGRYDWRLLLFVPAGLVGTAIGVRIYKRLSDARFRLVVNALLIVSGLSYLV